MSKQYVLVHLNKAGTCLLARLLLQGALEMCYWEPTPAQRAGGHAWPVDGAGAPVPPQMVTWPPAQLEAAVARREQQIWGFRGLT